MSLGALASGPESPRPLLAPPPPPNPPPRSTGTFCTRNPLPAEASPKFRVIILIVPGWSLASKFTITPPQRPSHPNPAPPFLDYHYYHDYRNTVSLLSNLLGDAVGNFPISRESSRSRAVEPEERGKKIVSMEFAEWRVRTERGSRPLHSSPSSLYFPLCFVTC